MNLPSASTAIHNDVIIKEEVGGGGEKESEGWREREASYLLKSADRNGEFSLRIYSVEFTVD